MEPTLQHARYSSRLGVAEGKDELTLGGHWGKYSIMGAMISSRQKTSQKYTWGGYLAWWTREVRIGFQGKATLTIMCRSGNTGAPCFQANSTAGCKKKLVMYIRPERSIFFYLKSLSILP